MTQQTGTVDTVAKIKDLEEENELLLLQLHLVQEELEVYFLKYKDLEAGRGGNARSTAGANINWVDDELPEALAEVERLKTLAQVQAEIKEIESHNALNVKLGNMLLEGSGSVAGISKLPFALLRFWRNATSKNIPAALGGKEFTRVIKVYEERGFAGVKNILKDDALSPIVKANAYTALARNLMRSDATAVAEAARKAFEIDPKPYRLKWLAYRTQEAGDALRAEAMLDLLPESMSFSDSEAKQVSQIHYEAKNHRQRKARQKTQIVSKQQQLLNQVNELKGQVEALNKEKAQLIQSRDQASQEIVELQGQLDTAEKEKAALSQECSALQQDKVSLAAARDEQSKLAAERQSQLAALSQERSALQQDKVSLAAARDEQSKLAAERQSQLAALNAEKAQLIQSRDQASQKIVELQGQLDTAEKEKAALSQERSALQQDNLSLSTAREEQAELAADRLNQINALTAENGQLQKKCEHLAKFESQNRDLMFRQNALEQELRKAEAQIELIKDLMIDDQRA